MVPPCATFGESRSEVGNPPENIKMINSLDVSLHAASPSVAVAHNTGNITTQEAYPPPLAFVQLKGVANASFPLNMTLKITAIKTHNHLLSIIVTLLLLASAIPHISKTLQYKE
jgi:hypothetical protein